MTWAGGPHGRRGRRRPPATPCRGADRRLGAARSTAPLVACIRCSASIDASAFHHEDDQGAGAPAADLLAEILALEMERHGPTPARGVPRPAADLVWRSCPAWSHRTRCRSSSPSGSLGRTGRACRCSGMSPASRWWTGSGGHVVARSCERGRSRPRRVALRCAGSRPVWPARSPAPGRALALLTAAGLRRGGSSPDSAVCSDTTAASASCAISSKRSRARSAAVPPCCDTPS